MKKFLSSPHPFAFLSILCWSPTFIFTRILADIFSPQALGFLRCLVASILLIAILIFRRTPLPEKTDWPRFILSALFGFSLYMIVFNRGMTTVTSATGSVILACVPILTNILASVFFQERLNSRQWIIIGVEFVGILILLLWDGSFSFNFGAVFVFAAACMGAVYNVLQRDLVKKYPGFQASAFTIFCGMVELLWAAPLAFTQLEKAPPSALWALAFLGIFTSAVGYVSWAAAFARAEKTSDVSNYMFLNPFIASLLGFLIAGEVPNLPAIIGGILILSGSILFNKQKTGAEPS